MVQSLPRCYYFNWSWDSFAQEIIASLSTVLWKVCAIRCQCSLSRRRDSQLQCCCRSWELCDCIRSEKRQEFELLGSKDSINFFTADACSNFFRRTCCANHKKHDKKEPELFKVEFRCAKMLCLCSKTYSCYDCLSNMYNFSSETKRANIWRQWRRTHGKISNTFGRNRKVTCTNRGFCTKNHCVAS